MILLGPGTTTSPNPMSTCRDTRALPSLAWTRARTPSYSAFSVILAVVTVLESKCIPSASTSTRQASFMTAAITSGLLSILPRRSISLVGREASPLHTENIKAL